MANPLQNFVDLVGPPVSAEWLNGVDVLVNSVFQSALINSTARAGLFSDNPLEINNGGTAARTVAQAQINLGIGALIAGALSYPPLPIEGATVVADYYPYGDIRRYGALVSATDNSAAINAALLVSANDVAAAFIPGGTWNCTSTLAAPPGSSMYGAGKASNLVFANGVDGIQFTTSDAGIVPQPRFFRDFAITGTLTGTANAAHGIYINTTTVDHVLFSNLALANFEFAVYVQGLYYSTFLNVWAINCYHGIYFNNQSVNVWITNCVWQHVSAGALITGSGNSTGISVQGAPEVEGLHIQGGSVYGFDYDILLGLIFECQIETVDISFANICPIFFTSSLGPLTIRDCWIELGSSASGTWNTGGTGTGNLTGVFITAITPAPSVSKVSIVGNEIVSDVTVSGSTGVYLGDSNNGVVFEDNQIRGFDIGIGGGNTLDNVGGYLTGASIRKNTITAATSSILLNSLSTDISLGPNYIVSGGQVTFNAGAPAGMVYEQPNVPMHGTAAFAAATSVAVVFANAMPYATYKVSLGGNAAGYCWVTSKATTGFTINCSVLNSNSVDWAIQ
jgi:hypothetical protein